MPKDKIIWDVGHQSYPHKILTERKSKMHTLRQGKGLSGFTKEQKVFMIHLELHMPQHLFLLG